MFLFINWTDFPNLRGRLIWVEMRMNSIVSTLLKENLADEELSRWNLNKASLQSHISISSDFHVFLGLLGCPNVRYTI